MAQVEQELQVNTYTTSWQYRPDVEALDDGGFVVVWRSDGSPETDTDGESIQARRFDSTGAPNGEQFQVNESTLGNQERPRLLRLDDGSLITTWVDDETEDLKLRRLSVDGTPNGNEVSLGISGSNIGLAPTTTGGFVVTFPTFAGNPSVGTVNIRIFDAAGTPVSTILPISEGAESARLPQIAAQGDDGFIVTWRESGIRARRLDTAGSKLGQELQISPDFGAPRVATRANGEFFLGWHRNVDMTTRGPEVFARFDIDGTPIGSEWTVEDPSQGETALLHDMVATDTGSLHAVFLYVISNGIGEGHHGIRLAEFDQNGQALEGPYEVSAYVEEQINKRWPRLAVSSSGPKVVWQAGPDTVFNEGGGFGDDLDRTSIQLRTAFEAMFADGFETGSTSRWLHSVGN